MLASPFFFPLPPPPPPPDLPADTRVLGVDALELDPVETTAVGTGGVEEEALVTATAVVVVVVEGEGKGEGSGPGSCFVAVDEDEDDADDTGTAGLGAAEAEGGREVREGLVSVREEGGGVVDNRAAALTEEVGFCA